MTHPRVVAVTAELWAYELYIAVRNLDFRLMHDIVGYIEDGIPPPLANDRLRELDDLKRRAEIMECVACPSD